MVKVEAGVTAKPRILEFGNLPCWQGGKCNDGLNNAIYNISRALADLEPGNVALAASDFFKISDSRNGLEIMGWDKKKLLLFVISHPLLFLFLLIKSIKGFVSYFKAEGFMKILFRNAFLRFAMETFKPDIVHLHGIRAVYYLPVVPKGIRVIVTLHGLVGQNKDIPEHTIFAKMEQSLCKNKGISYLVFVTKKIREEFFQIYGKPVSSTEVITNSFDSKVFKLINEEPVNPKPTLVTIASMSELKGQRRVLEGIKKSGKDVKYICVGNDRDNLVPTLTAYAEKNSIDFEYKGPMTPDQISRLLNETDFMILPSSSEGFGLVFLESLACGCPVILPSHLPIVEEGDLINGDNSILMHDESSDSICETLETLTTRVFNRKKIAEGVKIFSWEMVAKEYYRIFERSLAEKPTNSRR